ncbi:MAG: putative membrane protein YeaQ/YmgE (transglycosylase-associated protein family) [Verrucomicrobiales bacterium]|jgi:uncharacterized membrane protein YeaQ/YmgE (transglycosylase-associated protein family)
MFQSIHPLLAAETSLTTDWLSLIVIGVVVGLLLSSLLKERGFGFFGNAIIGIVGAILGAFLWDKLISRFVTLDLGQITIQFNQVLIALLGAFLFLALVSFVSKRKKS